MGVEKYAQDSDVAGSNAGLNAYFGRLWGPDPEDGKQDLKPSEKCLRDKAVSFYTDVASLLGSTNPKDCKALSTPSYIGCSENRPGLLAKAGDDSAGKLEPGWLWQLAMKHANGNPNAALHLIGLCGHDDTAHGSRNILDQSEDVKVAAINEKQANLEAAKKRVSDAEKTVVENPEKYVNAYSDFSFDVYSLRAAKSSSGIVGLSVV
jgi:hypothetical protein